MAKAKTRVFEIARAVGVQSKDILDKCRAEGLEIKNHMSAVSAGLEETIRDWFSEPEDGGAHTAVELTEHIDLEKAREKAKKSRKTVEPVQVEEPVEEPAEEPAEEPQEGDSELGDDSGDSIEETVADEVVAEEVVDAEPVEENADIEQAVEIENAPDVTEEAVAPMEPEAEEPAQKVAERGGPQLVPRPAKLSGPRVVRVEAPERVERPRPRTRPNARPGGGQQTGARPAFQPETTPASVDARRGAGKPVEEKAADKDKKRRSRATSRRSGPGSESDSQARVKEWKERDLLERANRIAGAGTGYYRRRVSKGKGGSKGGRSSAAVKTGVVDIQEPISVKKLSAATGLKATIIISKLMADGVLATVNQTIDSDKAYNIVAEFGIELNIQKQLSAGELLLQQLDQREKLELTSRATVVTILGHVDHGKTSLLDYIRDSRVAEGEAGGITQAMGSYRYDTEDRHVTFLDTPGHEAFTTMRSRGASMTDVVVLVVAADDGVMPQTEEAINHAKAAGVPIVVALNKIDLPNADINKALGQLAEHGLQAQEWGGDTEVVKTSAATGEGVEELLEILSLEAELLELKAEVDAPASGYVVEAAIDTARGVMATVLNMNGTLKHGDVVLAGTGFGFVRNIYDDSGNTLKEAGPAVPVSITGLNDLPDAGEKYYVVESIEKARTVANELKEIRRQEMLTASASTPKSLEELFGKLDAQDKESVPLVVKAESRGSLEALKATLQKLCHEEVDVNIIHSGVGGINESDVNLANVSKALVIGFNVSAEPEARRLADDYSIKILEYNVIYDIVDDVKKLVIDGLAPEIKIEALGRAEVRQAFKVSRLGTIAGCIVTDGIISRNAKVKIIRNGGIIEEGRSLDSLKRVKDDAREVKSGLECGIKIDGFNDIKQGDIIECYKTIEVARTE